MGNNGGARPGAGRPLGSLNRKTNEMIKTVRDVVAENPEKYYEVFRLLINDANDPKVSPRTRIVIAEFLASRVEGKVPDEVRLSGSVPTVADALQALRYSNEASVNPGASWVPPESSYDVSSEIIADEHGNIIAQSKSITNE